MTWPMAVTILGVVWALVALVETLLDRRGPRHPSTEDTGPADWQSDGK